MKNTTICASQDPNPKCSSQQQKQYALELDLKVLATLVIYEQENIHGY
jgi:hypothetical protein